MGKQVLVSGYIGFSNFGDEMIFSLLSNYLMAKGAEVTALSSNPDNTRKEHLTKAVYYRSPLLLSAILKTDLLISGGGSLIQNKTSNKSLFYYLMIILLAKIFGKKVIIFAQGIESITGFIPRLITKLVLKTVDLITVRDENSVDFLNKMGLKSVLLTDPVRSLPCYIQEKEKTLGIQLRKFEGMSSSFLDNLAEFTGKFFSDKKIRVFSFQNDYDADICTKFVNILKNKYNDLEVELVLATTTTKTMYDFSKLEYLIAMRYHACLLGLMAGVKTIPVIYDKKVQALADEFEIKGIDCTSNEKFFEQFGMLENFKLKKEVAKEFDWSVFDKYFE